MLPLIIGGAFIAGYLWIISLTTPQSTRPWYDEHEREKFLQERENWSRMISFWNLPR